MKTRTARSDPQPIADLFLGDLLVDYAPKDSTEMMERPFFSLSKKRRLKPIHHSTEDGKLFIEVTANPTYGMATIWDADILIWCISRIMKMKEERRNDISGVIQTTPHEILTGIARGTGGQDYLELDKAIDRLRNTQVQTNIRSGRKKYIKFMYLGDTEGEGAEAGNLRETRSLTLRVPPWLLEGILDGNVLTLDREYFLLKGGLERAIYRIARKHAGSQPDGWKCRVETLQRKTGSEGAPKKFAFRVREMCKLEEDPQRRLPGYRMTMTTTVDGTPAVHFVNRDLASFMDERARTEAQQARRARQRKEDERARRIDAGLRPEELE